MRSSVDLYWIPLGAGAHCVRLNGIAYEALIAVRQRRARRDLYHAALEVHLDGVRFVIEVAPVWDRDEPDRGVVAEGPVGAASLGRFRWFRYEVRVWREGHIPDIRAAVDSPVRVSAEREAAQRVLDQTPAVPVLTWGRDELGLGEMWNSNSVIAWLLHRSGHELAGLTPPEGGRAPGWLAGVVAAQRADRAATARGERPRSFRSSVADGA
jgi:hypothetical protein